MGPAQSAAAPLPGPTSFQTSLSAVDFREGNIVVTRGAGNNLSVPPPSDTSACSFIGFFGLNGANDISSMEFFVSNLSRIRIYHDGTAKKLQLQCGNGTTTETIVPTVTQKVDDPDRVIAMGVDSQTTGLKRVNCSVDGVSDTGVTRTCLPTDIGHTNDFTESDWAFGAKVAGQNRCSGMIYIFALYNVYVDWDAIKANWWGANGLIDPGPDGSGWTGSKPLAYFRLLEGEPVTEFFINRAATGVFDQYNIPATGQVVAPYWPKLAGHPVVKYNLDWWSGDSFIDDTQAISPTGTIAQGFKHLVSQYERRCCFNQGKGGQSVIGVAGDPFGQILPRDYAWLSLQPVVTYNTPGDPASGIVALTSNNQALERRTNGWKEFCSALNLSIRGYLEGGYNNIHGSPFISGTQTQGDIVAAAASVVTSNLLRLAAYRAAVPGTLNKSRYLFILPTNGGQSSPTTPPTSVFLGPDEEYSDGTHNGVVNAGNGKQYNALMQLINAHLADATIAAQCYDPYNDCMNFGNVNGPNDTTPDPIDLLPRGWMALCSVVFGAEWDTIATTNLTKDNYDIAHGVIPTSGRFVGNVTDVTGGTYNTGRQYGIHLNKYFHFAYAIGILRKIRSLGWTTFTGIT